MGAHTFPSSPSPLGTAYTQHIAAGHEGKQEIRLYGLSESLTTPALIAFFSQMATVCGILLHPDGPGKQWAQVWVRGEEEAERCMRAQAQLGVSGVSMSRAPSQAPPSHPQNPLPPLFAQTPAPSAFPPLYGPLTIPQKTPTRSQAPFMSELALHRLPPTPASFDRPMTVPLRHDLSGMGYRHLDPSGPLPRNLYIVELPLDMTETQFRSLFEQHGVVEHCKLLSQLDGMGRRRGFILMASHREALEAMRGMNGRIIESVKGSRMDVSWALVQREARHFGIGAMPNRVIHPPVHPIRREVLPAVDAAVIAEGLDPEFFPSANLIRELFSTFGPIMQASILTSSPDLGLTALIQFEHAMSADLLIQASGMVVGSKRIHVRPFQRQHHQPAQLQYQPYQLPQEAYPGAPQARYLSDPSTSAGRPFPPVPLHQATSFDPFGPANLAADLQAATDRLAKSRLNAASSPFVPTFGQDQPRSLDQQDPYPLHRLEQKTPSPRTVPAGADIKSPHSASHSSSTKISSSTSSGSGTQHGSRSSKTRDTSDTTAKDDSASAEDAPSAKAGRFSMGEIPVMSRMHERWLKASIGKDDHWVKSAAWCELTITLYRPMCGSEHS